MFPNTVFSRSTATDETPWVPTNQTVFSKLGHTIITHKLTHQWKCIQYARVIIYAYDRFIAEIQLSDLYIYKDVNWALITTFIKHLPFCPKFDQFQEIVFYFQTGI